VNGIVNFSHFDSDYPTLGLTVTGLARVNCIKMYLREVGWGGVDWIDLAQDRDLWRAFVYKIINLRVL
jgi:hypothetical protein